ncbi:MAG: hypothetical protein GX230_02390 [Lentisphaerae bacterium]|nr:hypothetical protein [Lentisphaerota bacterium]
MNIFFIRDTVFCYHGGHKETLMPTTITTLEKKIAAIRRELAALGPMRPGNLGMQYRDRKEKLGGFWQISYTHKMRSRSEYVRPEHLESVKQELANFATFRKLTDQWIELGLELSRLKRQAAKPKAKAGKATKARQKSEAGEEAASG